MSLFNQLLAQIGNTPGGSEAPDKDGTAGESLLDGLLNMVGGGGSFTNLVKNFQEHGLGDVVNSWISTGENLPITPEQLEQGLGTDRVQQLAEQSGLPQWSVLPMLSQLLPNVIDKLTPQGSVPTSGFLEQARNLFRSDDADATQTLRERGDYGSV